ncbi:hypothetical protein ACRTDU_15075 [Sunxiuqinia elliptica]
MENIKVATLDSKSLKLINGGDTRSYYIGKNIGDGLRKAFIACGIISLFL